MLARERLLADRRHDVHFGRKYAQRDVEPHLVVASTGRTVRNRRSADASRDIDHRDRLLGPLGRHRQWVHLTAEHVGLDQHLHEAVEHRLARIDLMVLGGSHRECLGADRGAGLGGGTTGVDEHGMHDEPPLSEPGNAVGRIEPA